MKADQTQSIKESEDPEHKLFAAIATIKTALEAKNFFHDLCTPAEIQAMADRWRVVGPIKQGASYRQIHAETGVSITTIGRVARYISLGAGGYNVIFERTEGKSNETKSKIKNCNTKKRPPKQRLNEPVA